MEAEVDLMHQNSDDKWIFAPTSLKGRIQIFPGIPYLVRIRLKSDGLLDFHRAKELQSYLLFGDSLTNSNGQIIALVFFISLKSNQKILKQYSKENDKNS